MNGFLSSSARKLTWRGTAVIGALVVASTPALAVAHAAAAAAAPAIACQTSWLASNSGSWADAANWSAGVPTSATNACITKAGAYTVHVTGVQNAAALVMGANNGAQTLSIEGTCDAGSGELHLGASSVVNPHGTVALTDTGDCQFSWLDQTAGTLTSNGTVNVLDSGSTQDRFLYGDVVNNGTIGIGVTLKSDDGGHTQTNRGTVAIATGASWLDRDSFANLGGSLSTTGTGSFLGDTGTFVQGDGATTGNVTVADGDLSYTGSGASTIVTHGEVNLSGDVAAGQTLTAQGTCAGPAYLGVSGPWTNAGTLVLTDVGDCQYAWLDQMSGTFTNTGTLTSADSGTTQARFLYGDFVNSGTVNVDAPLTSDDSGFTQTNTGTVAIADGSSWVDEDSFRNLGGSLTTTGTGEFDQVDGTFVQGAGTTGNVVVTGAGVAYRGSGAGTIVAHGAVALSGNLAAGQSLTVEGECFDGAALVTAGAPVSNAGTITLTDTGNCGSAGLALTTGTLTNTGTIHVVDSGTTQDRLFSGSLSNAGTVVLDAGTNLNASAGTFTNEAAGTLELHLASTTDFGRLTSTNAVQIGGTLNIVRDAAFAPQTGRSFAIMTCAGCSGTFDAIGGQSINARSAFVASSTATTVTLSVLKTADLGVTGSAPASVASGTDFAFTFVVTNAGPKVAANTVLTDKLPAGVTFVSGSAGCTHAGSLVTCAVGSLGKSKAATVTITVTAGPAAKITDTASVKADAADLTPADDSAKVGVTIT